MIRKFQILPAVIVTLSLQFGQASAQEVRGTIPLPSIVAVPAQAALSFHAAAVGIASSSAQKLTASFTVSGYSGSFTPTGALHYGHDYVIDTLKCTVSGSSETCKVTISFIPTLPGARKDALLLKDGATTLATVLLGGIGQSPQALIQPGIVTSPVDTGSSYYIYQSVVDENGTVYYVADESNAVYSYTKAGVLTELPITGLSSPHAIAIDGAGTLYIAQNEFATDIVTYTADGVQGTITVVPPAPPYVPCSSFEYLYSVAVDQGGNLFVLEIECGEIFELKLDGAYVTTAINPTMIQPSEIALAANDNLFIGGYDINKLTAGGVQTQINTVGALEGVAVDAAGTVYATRYTGGGVAELPSSGYSTSIANLDPTASPLGESVGSDGTVYVGNYYNLDKVDRSQGAIAFGEQDAGVKSTVEDVSFYNGGNESLTLSTFTRSGAAAFALGTATTKPCKKALVIAPGGYCQVAATMTAPHAGTFSGTITFTSNSLNATGTEQKVALSGYVYGVWATASPTSLAFGSQTDGTTSTAKTVTLTNHGDLYSATFGTPVSPSGFNVGLGTCTTEIAVGSSCKLSVTFSPTDPVAYGGTVTVPVSSNGGGTTPSVTFTVSGTGVAAAALAPAK
jgi:Abnormal spindle-like microcephaly-assoc'd, ASPM-SPD-2-Hydin